MNQPWVYIVLIGLLVIVYATLLPRTRSSKGAQGPTIQEIEETMEHFAAELEEQNEALIRQLAETKRDYDVQTAKLSSRVEMLEKQAAGTSQELAKLGMAYEQLLQASVQSMGGHEKKTAESPSQIRNTQEETTASEESHLQEQDEEGLSNAPMNMKQRYADLFALYDQGKSTDVIAKKLNMNKGEINLIIQLAKQEEQLNAQK
ncbi:DUF6115 domain-containing protein [Paenibacillus sp. NPDC056579]|uniref:DUF6115 domain-containing protein n=1 Tax=unclassified Paenibacillus TaxID=185978 RepID=UPI001EF80312|nr:hypothetical protein [Paenibacillus sp. H1-7]ULL17311.1 hypothetical protein DVH26_24425 [Paenibacillus sp. H1-7]